jgi:phosphohistidine phosphatase
MKKLLIMRHAKTEIQEIFRSDFVRDLTHNGIVQAQSQGKFLSVLPFEPQLILVSPSTRTQQTLEESLPMTQWDNPEIKTQDDLYHASLATLIDTVSEVSDEVDELMIIGHNFGVLELVQHLSGEYIEKFRTGAMALFHADIESWKGFVPEVSERIYLKEPLDED